MFNLNDIIVSSDDIALIEQHFGFTFNQKQKDVISYWSNGYVQACPGSGKTTTLAAKLMILANKLPNSFCKGICIITHTNTAVNEIKHKLGEHSNYFNIYPHHLGTIQSFIDKYLTIPAYKNYYKRSPKILSPENWLLLLKKHPEYEILSKNAFIIKSNIDISSLVFNITNFAVSTKLDDSDPFLNDTTETYKKVYNFKKKLLNKGYLSYNEAYSLAYSYLRKNPQLKNIFTARFPLVLIDEMQDMEEYQYKLIDYLFDNTDTILLKIGDLNQSIFSSSTQYIMEQIKSKKTLHLTETNRLPNHLAKIIEPICLLPQKMNGNNTNNPIPPTILVFDDTTKDRVKERFAEMVINYGLTDRKQPIFKAVGGTKDGIKEYWSDFNKSSDNTSQETFSTLKSYIDKCQYLSSLPNVKKIINTLLNSFCRAFELVGIKHPLTNQLLTPNTFKDYALSEKTIEYKELNKQLSLLIAQMSVTGNLDIKEVSQLITLWVNLLEGHSNAELVAFLNDNLSFFTQSNNNTNQIYNYKDLSISFDTIHGVKGETHTATLYMETYHRTHDIGDKILNFIISDNKLREKMRTTSKYMSYQTKLPLAYVAMTRATDFLCLAVHKDRVPEPMRKYFEEPTNGWLIENL